MNLMKYCINIDCSAYEAKVISRVQAVKDQFDQNRSFTAKTLVTSQAKKRTKINPFVSPIFKLSILIIYVPHDLPKFLCSRRPRIRIKKSYLQGV